MSWARGRGVKVGEASVDCVAGIAAMRGSRYLSTPTRHMEALSISTRDAIYNGTKIYTLKRC